MLTSLLGNTNIIVTMDKGYLFLNYVKYFRNQAGISQDKLAKMVGVSRNTISSIECNNYIPNTKLALLIAKALKKNVNELFILADKGVFTISDSDLDKMIDD